MRHREYRLVVSSHVGERLVFYYDTKAELTVAEMMIAKGLEHFSGATAQQWVDQDHIRFNGESRYMDIIL